MGAFTDDEIPWSDYAKAASISRGVLALRTEICSPRPRAAFGISRNVASAMGALAAAHSARKSQTTTRPFRLIF